MDIVNHNTDKTIDLDLDLKLQRMAFDDEPLGEGALGDRRAKTSLRMHYEAQVAVIQKQLGGLEDIRLGLGLSARKICQLLLIDPSAWTRWTKNGDQAPPHIWRALQWYLIIQDKIPGLTPQYFIGKDAGVLHAEAMRRVSEIESQFLSTNQDLVAKNQTLEVKVQVLENQVRANRVAAIMIGISALIMAVAFIKMVTS
ncbi:MAG: hypothetical protein BroJett041_23980 [Candidatus Jettenia caeni]|nr:MAG: hypothetical protein BroJett041_23980 [Candidatus Jettenia caeni]